MIAYAAGAITDFRRLPDNVRLDAAGVIAKLARGEIQGVPLPMAIDEDLKAVHRVRLADGGALLYLFHPAPASREQFATAHLLAAGFDNRELRERTLQRSRPADGHTWALAYTRDFFSTDVPALREDPALYAAMGQTIKTLASPNPPPSHDPLASDRAVYLGNSHRLSGQTIRQVPFDTPERINAGAEPRGLLTFRTLRPAMKSRINTVLIVAATPAVSVHIDVQRRLQLTNHVKAFNSTQERWKDILERGRGEVGRSRSVTGDPPQPSSAPAAPTAGEPDIAHRHRNTEPGMTPPGR